MGNRFIGILMTLSQPRIEVSVAVDFCVAVPTFLVELVPAAVCLEAFDPLAVVAPDPDGNAPPPTGVCSTDVCVDDEVVTVAVSEFDWAAGWQALANADTRSAAAIPGLFIFN